MIKDPLAQVNQVLRIHNVSRFVGAIVIPIIFWFLVAPSTPISWLAFALLSFMGIWIFSLVSFVAAIFYVAVKNPEPEKIDEEELPLIERISVTIVNTPEPFGQFGDMSMFEWMDVKLPGDEAIKRFTFSTTVTGELAKSQVPQSCIIVPPGIVYSPPAD